MSKICYVCNKNIGTFGSTLSYNSYVTTEVPLPEGMSELDVTCDTCYRQAKNAHSEEVEEAKMETKTAIQELHLRTPEYKKKWDKNGIIQFKNERIAILRRAYGAQVQFIIAFDDLTAEGYELKAIDEGKTADGGQGLSGGVSSYYYFQRNESLSFPNGRNELSGST